MYGPRHFIKIGAFKTKGQIFLDTDQPRPEGIILYYMAKFVSGLYVHSDWFPEWAILFCTARSEKSNFTRVQLMAFS